MFPTDHMHGSFEFHTNLKQLEDGKWVAEAMGISAIHRDREQAINDLNQKIDTAVVSGQLRPDQG